jgi:magnesium transporter
VLTILYSEGGRAEQRLSVDLAWLAPNSPGVLWVDLSSPTPEEASILSTVFGFHELAIEDALSTTHHPKIETYDDYVYMILHGIDFNEAHHRFATHDTDFFIGPRYLVTVHDGKTRSIAQVRGLCGKASYFLDQGPLSLAHRILETMVGHYRPEVEKLSEKLDKLERDVVERPSPDHMKVILELKRDVASLRRIVHPQRDVVSRLARRELSMVTEPLAYRFRDVYDSLVRLTDEANFFQDRISGLLDAHLASMSNRLSSVMKVLTLIATLFMPMTMLTGLYGMNVKLPELPGGTDMQFWWVLGALAATGGGMIAFFSTRKWL